MANGINPYIGAAARQTIADSLIDSQRNIKEGKIAGALGRQELKQEYQEDLSKADEEQARRLAKEKNKTFLEKAASSLAPVLSIFNPLAGTVLGSLGGASEVIRTADQQKENLKFARDMGIDTSKYMGTFLEDTALDDVSIREDILDAYKDSIIDDPLSILRGGIESGLKARTIGQGISGISEGISSFRAQDAASKADGTYKSFLQSIQEGLEKNVDLGKLLEKLSPKQKAAIMKLFRL